MVSSRGSGQEGRLPSPSPLTCPCLSSPQETGPGEQRRPFRFGRRPSAEGRPRNHGPQAPNPPAPQAPDEESKDRGCCSIPFPPLFPTGPHAPWRRGLRREPLCRPPLPDAEPVLPRPPARRNVRRTPRPGSTRTPGPWTKRGRYRARSGSSQRRYGRTPLWPPGPILFGPSFAVASLSLQLLSTCAADMGSKWVR